jgi:hypothetical protein
MQTEYTRRSLLLLAGAGLAGVRLDAAAADFWNKKPPSQWTREEIDRLITKSPWAKEVKAAYAPGESPTSGGDYPNGGSPGGYPPNSGGGYPGGRSRGGIGIPGIGGLSIPGLGGSGGGRPRGGTGGSGRGQVSPYQGTVRWESALPIEDAMKSGPPEQFDGHYVISVNGIPLMGGSRYQGEDDTASTRKQEQDDMDRIKALSSLQVKGRDNVQAGVAIRQVSSGSSFLIGFSKELLPLHQDMEVIFSSQIGRLVVKAPFLLKEMLYHGELAV